MEGIRNYIITNEGKYTRSRFQNWNKWFTCRYEEAVLSTSGPIDKLRIPVEKLACSTQNFSHTSTSKIEQ